MLAFAHVKAFHLACTAGRSYTTGGALGGGNFQVMQE